MEYIIWYDGVCLGVDLATFFMAGLDDENWGQAQIPVIIKKLALSKRKIGLTNVIPFKIGGSCTGDKDIYSRTMSCINSI